MRPFSLYAQVATTLHNLGSLLLKMGRPEESEPLLRRCVEIQRKLLGREHVRHRNSLDELGLVLKKMNRLEEAENVTERARAHSYN